MGEDKRKLALAVAGGIVLFGLGLVAGREITIEPAGGERGPAATTTESAERTAAGQPEEARPKMEDGTLPERSSSDPQACESDLKARVAANGIRYEKGSILVAFKDGVAYERAVSVLDSEGLELHNASGQRDSYAAQGWLIARVPQGSEFKYACAMRDAEGVRFSNINPIFDLAR